MSTDDSKETNVAEPETETTSEDHSETDSGGESLKTELVQEPSKPKATSASRNFISKWGRRALLAMLVLFFFSFLIVVREVILPFILAVVLVYVLAPIVDWMSSKRVRNVRMPRWVAVIVLYIFMFLSVYSFSVVILPRFYGEFQKIAEEAPGMVRKTTQVWIPQFNQKLTDFLSRLTAPMAEAEKSHEIGIVPVVQGPESENGFEIEILDSDEALEGYGENGDAEVPHEEAAEENPSGSQIAVTVPQNKASNSSGSPPDMASNEFVNWLQHVTIDVEKTGEDRYRVKMHPNGKATDTPQEDIQGIGLQIQKSLADSMQNLEKYVGDVVSFGRNLVARVVGSLMTLVLTLMIAAFMLIDTPRIMSFFRSLIPPHYREEYDDILVGIDKGLGGVIRGQIMICLVNGTLTGLGLMILGVKYAVTLAMIATVFSLVPIFGTIISSIPSVGIALTQSFSLGVLVLLWITIIHLIEANLLNPKIIGTSAKIHPVLVVFALVAGEYAYGLFGALLAVPVFSIFQTLFLYFRQKAYPE